MAERIDALKTEYNGVVFRSRTEARWAVFFDSINITYHYEKEEIRLSNGQNYLPDFHLPEFNIFLEVKPNSDAIVTEECVKARQLAHDLKEAGVWLATGAPSIKSANIIPLSNWKIEDDITKILSIPESRYQILEDRRDEGIFWLYAETVYECMSHTYLIGGWGRITDHAREPMMKGLVKAAYERAIGFKF